MSSCVYEFDWWDFDIEVFKEEVIIDEEIIGFL